MKIFDFLKYDEGLTLQKKTVVILRWIALIGQLITIYIVHFFLNFMGIVLPKFTSLIFVSSGIIPNLLATS